MVLSHLLCDGSFVRKNVDSIARAAPRPAQWLHLLGSFQRTAAGAGPMRLPALRARREVRTGGGGAGEAVGAEAEPRGVIVRKEGRAPRPRPRALLRSRS